MGERTELLSQSRGSSTVINTEIRVCQVPAWSRAGKVKEWACHWLYPRETGKGKWALREDWQMLGYQWEKEEVLWLLLLATSQFLSLFVASWVSPWEGKTSGLIAPRTDQTLLPSCSPFRSSCCCQQVSFLHAAGAPRGSCVSTNSWGRGQMGQAGDLS